MCVNTFFIKRKFSHFIIVGSVDFESKIGYNGTRCGGRNVNKLGEGVVSGGGWLKAGSVTERRGQSREGWRQLDIGLQRRRGGKWLEE